MLQELSKIQVNRNENIRDKMRKSEHYRWVSSNESSIKKNYNSVKASPHILKTSIDLTLENKYAKRQLRIPKLLQNENKNPFGLKIGFSKPSKTIEKNNKIETKSTIK